MRHLLLALLFCLSAAVLQADDFAARRDGNWHQWRGPHASGIAPQADPPVEWSETKNIRWKVRLPGEGSGTPIVWENRIFVVSAVETERKPESPPQVDDRSKTIPPPFIYQYTVSCLDRQTGRLLWSRVAREEAPHEGRHATNTFASASPTTDGRRVYVSFGSRGLFCYDMDGKPLWQRDLGDMRTRYGWGEATSPVVHGSSLVVNWDHEDQSAIYVLDAATGKTRWQAERDEPTTWATPLIVENGGRTQAIVSGTNRVRSYDLETGDVIWECGGQTVNAIPSPILNGETVICMSGYRGAAAYAIPLNSTGDLTGSDRIRWSHHQSTPYVPSPIVYGGRLYFTRGNTAILTCLDAETGEPVFGPERLPRLENIYASPAAAAGRIYFVGRDGTTLVLRAADELNVLATNTLDEPIDASPVLVARQLFLRGTDHLYCVEAE